MMSSLSCLTQIPELSGLKSNELTVGRPFVLKCSGEWPAEFNFSKSFIKEGSADIYYRVFKAEGVSSQEILIEMTTYKTGSVPLNGLILSDGVHDLVLVGEAVQVASVLKPTEDGKPPQAFPALFPLNLGIPTYYLATFAFALMLVCVWFLFKLKKRADRNKLRESLKKYDSPIDPETQFYRLLRQAEKEGYPIDELEKAFKLYNLRLYKIPLFELDTKKSLIYFKNEFPHLSKNHIDLKKFLTEFEEVKNRSGAMSESERLNFVKKLYRYVEKSKNTERGIGVEL